MTPRRTLITGGTGGLGRGVVRRFLERGDRVHVPWVAADEVEELEDALAELPGEARRGLELVEGDVTDPDWLAGYSDHLRVEGGVDGLLNLVGGFTMAPVEETDPGAWERMITLNARSTFLVIRAMLPLLKASGRGAVVNVASAPAVHGQGGGMVAYTASKGAVVSLTRALAREVADDGVTVNAVAPTTIYTDATVAAMPEADKAGWIRPDEVASLMLWYTGDDARRVTGNVVVMGR
jgi:NAD(P)-dependent dehydrogenase (short-subunit alcohol dehydrogenase family)